MKDTERSDTAPPSSGGAGMGKGISVLVAFASRQGSTKEIAERIAAKLGKLVGWVEVRPVDQVHDVNAYDAVVIGSAIHDQAWLPEAAEFVRHNRNALARRPVWLFSVGAQGGLRGPLGRFMRDVVPARIVALRDTVHAGGYRVFGGVMTRNAVPRPARLLYWAMGGRYGDLRDWPEVDAWAEQIVRALRNTVTSAVPAG
jgi:menaquinone-dependent protoporphyrinogen oxidase